MINKLLEQIIQNNKNNILQIIPKNKIIELLDHYIKHIPKSLNKTHIQLAKDTNVKPEHWKILLENPHMQEYISNEIEKINTKQRNLAEYNITNAKNKLELAKATKLIEIKRKAQQKTNKPFNIYMLPKETIAYKNTLLNIKKLINTKKYTTIDEIITDLSKQINKVIPQEKGESNQK